MAGGFIALRNESDDQYTGGPLREYVLQTTTSTTIGSLSNVAAGDVVFFTGSAAQVQLVDGENDIGRRTVDTTAEQATTPVPVILGAAVAGVVVGFKVDPNEIYQNGAPKGIQSHVRINTSPDTLYEVLIDPTQTNTVNMDDVGQNADYVKISQDQTEYLTSPVGGMFFSNFYMAVTNPSGTGTRPLRIERLFDDTGTGTPNRAWVRFHANAYFSTAGITIPGPTKEEIQKMVDKQVAKLLAQARTPLQTSTGSTS